MTKCKCLHLQGLAYFTYTEIVCSSLLINIKVFKMASLGQKHNVLQCVIYMMCSSATSYLAFVLFES